MRVTCEFAIKPSDHRATKLLESRRVTRCERPIQTMRRERVSYIVLLTSLKYDFDKSGAIGQGSFYKIFYFTHALVALFMLLDSLLEESTMWQFIFNCCTMKFLFLSYQYNCALRALFYCSHI